MQVMESSSELPWFERTFVQGVNNPEMSQLMFQQMQMQQMQQMQQQMFQQMQQMNLQMMQLMQSPPQAQVCTIGESDLPHKSYQNSSLSCLLKNSHEEYALPVDVIELVKEDQYHGFPDEALLDHLDRFETLCNYTKPRNFRADQFKSRLFFFSLAGKAQKWLMELSPAYLTSWETMRAEFIDHFYSKEKTKEYREKIIRFAQNQEESFDEAWERYRGYQRECPHHGYAEEVLLQTFYYGAKRDNRLAMDVASNGDFTTQTVKGAYQLIENMASSARYCFNDPQRQMYDEKPPTPAEPLPPPLAPPVYAEVGKDESPVFEEKLQVTYFPLEQPEVGFFIEMEEAEERIDGPATIEDEHTMKTTLQPLLRQVYEPGILKFPKPPDLTILEPPEEFQNVLKSEASLPCTVSAVTDDQRNEVDLHLGDIIAKSMEYELIDPEDETPAKNRLLEPFSTRMRSIAKVEIKGAAIPRSGPDIPNSCTKDRPMNNTHQGNKKRRECPWSETGKENEVPWEDGISDECARAVQLAISIFSTIPSGNSCSHHLMKPSYLPFPHFSDPPLA